MVTNSSQKCSCPIRVPRVTSHLQNIEHQRVRDLGGHSSLSGVYQGQPRRLRGTLAKL